MSNRNNLSNIKNYGDDWQESFSWRFSEDGKVAIKLLDKSSIVGKGTGIPKSYLNFFNAEMIKVGEKYEIQLEYNQQSFFSIIESVNEKSPRVRIVWGTEFSSVIKKVFPQWFDYFKNDGEEGDDAPKIKFEITNTKNKYIVSFFDSDSNGEEIKDFSGPQNIIIKYLPFIKKYHYAQKAKPEHDYWVAFYQSRISEYKKKFQDSFNFIIYGMPDNVSDFYSIPYSTIKGFLDETNKKPEYQDRWILSIHNGMMTIHGGTEVHNLNVDRYFHNVENIPQLPEFKDFVTDYNELEYKKLKIERIDIEKFVESFSISDFGEIKEHFIRNPEKVRVHEIVNNCEKGEWVLPHFQRYFDWSREDIRLFLDAVFKNYYVGSFLFWEVEGEPEFGIQFIQGIEKRNQFRPKNIILDGQQRITSLIYAIIAPNSNLFSQLNIWENTGISKEHPVYYYIDFSEYLRNPYSDDTVRSFNKKIERIITFNQLLFPFYELEHYLDWLYEFEEYLESKSEDHRKIKSIRNVIRKRLESIREKYEFPYISLPNSLQIDQVTDIFLGVNTKGKRLDVFDLLIARLYKYKIQLKIFWEKTISKYPNIKRYQKQNEQFPVYILMAISLFYEKGAKKVDILNIYNNIFSKSSTKFESEWDDFSDYINKAIEKLENLKDGYGVRSEKDLPYATIIPVLAALLKIIDNHENKAICFKKLDEWYWASVFTASYSSAADSQMNSDFKEMKDWFDNDSAIPSTLEDVRRGLVNFDLISLKSESNVKYKGVLSLVALRGAKDFDTGLYLVNSRKNDKDHIFPKAKDKFGTYKDVNSVMNITWMSPGTNQKIKNAKSPSDYVKVFISERYHGNQEDFLKILETHFINKDAYNCLVDNQFQQFIIARENEIVKEIKSRLGVEDTKNASTLILPDHPFSNKKIYSDAIGSCEGYIWWVDKYFSKPGLELLVDSINYDKVKEIKILMSIEKVNEKFRESFKDFRQELKKKGIDSSLRVITNSKMKATIHDRWIIAKNIAYNLPSPDTLIRGQFSEIKKTEPDILPFSVWWSDCIDIIDHWDEIKRALSENESTS